MLKPKPFWLSWFTRPDVWVTIWPVVYYPVGVNPSEWPSILTHENVHLTQQETYGKWRWLWRYIWRGAFMLGQEAEAVAAEVMASPAGRREAIIQDYCRMFSTMDGAYETADHRACADSYAEARAAIDEALGRIPQ